MGRLAGFRYRQIIKRLKKLGFEFDRQAAGSHETGLIRNRINIPPFPITLETFPRGPLRAILKQAGVTPDKFLSK